MYYFVHPTNKETRENTPAVVDWEFANKEICQAKGFSVGGGSGMSKGLLVLFVFQGDRKVALFAKRYLTEACSCQLMLVQCSISIPPENGYDFDFITGLNMKNWTKIG